MIRYVSLIAFLLLIVALTISHTDQKMIRKLRSSNLVLWKQTLATISKPFECEFLDDSYETLAACIIEPRKHEDFAPVVWQFANIYNRKASLHIFHGIENETSVRKACEGWRNVKFYNLETDNLDFRQYAKLLASQSFWDHFRAKQVFLFQTDTLIFKEIEEKFKAYDFIGAPWSHYALANVPFSYQVGNGGFSLRNVEFSRKQCSEYPSYFLREDVFFAKAAYKKGTLPDRDLAKQFSVEAVFYDKPCGMHNAFHHLPTPQLTQVLSCLQ